METCARLVNERQAHEHSELWIYPINPIISNPPNIEFFNFFCEIVLMLKSEVRYVKAE
jgi:hypothetical protein